MCSSTGDLIEIPVRQLELGSSETHAVLLVETLGISESQFAVDIKFFSVANLYHGETQFCNSMNEFYGTLL